MISLNRPLARARACLLADIDQACADPARHATEHRKQP